jgi:hypothetical protein
LRQMGVVVANATPADDASQVIASAKR